MVIIYLIIFTIILFIIFQNYGELSKTLSIKIDLLFTSFETKELAIGIWLIISFLLGAVLGYIRAIPSLIKNSFLSAENERLKEKIKDLEKEKKEMEVKNEETEKREEEK